MKAVLTRNGDYFVPLRDRMRRARAQQADLFVSIHADSIRDRSIDGSSVYILSQRGATDEASRWLAERENASDLIGGVSLDDKGDVLASVLLDLSQSASLSASQVAAERVLRQLNRVGEVRKPQVQQARFMVLKSPDIPSMLVETAYISNPQEEQRLRTQAHQAKLAAAIHQRRARLFLCQSAGGHARRAAGRAARRIADFAWPGPAAADCSGPFSGIFELCENARLARSPLPIQLLSDALISQIAAGEVIERPASVVKELVENALDAGAARIEVELERGGCGLIRVRDDGIGIDPQEIAAGAGAPRHQQNRLARGSGAASPRWGFAARRCRASPRCRGSRWCRARRARRMPGSVRCSRRRCSAPPAPASHPPGTSVEVRDLFFNVPARRKFLRSESTEYQHIVRMLERLALSRFEVAFSLIHNGKAVWSLPAADTGARSGWQRVARICGEEFAAHVIELKHDTESLRLSGWLALPTFSRSQSDLQFAFLNGRFVRDKLLAGAVRLAYQDVLFHGRFSRLRAVSGRGSARRSTSTRTRRSWRCDFAIRAAMHDFVFRTLERALADTRPSAESAGSAPLDWLTGSARFKALGRRARRTLRCPRAGAARELRMPIVAMWRSRPGLGPRHGGARSAGRRSPDVGTPGVATPWAMRIAQLHGVYILAQTADGMVLVDMHAAHERVMYESMKKLLAGETAQQQLLMPEILHVTPAQAEAAETHAQEFAALGFGVSRARRPISWRCGRFRAAGGARSGRHRARRACRISWSRATRGASRSRSITCSATMACHAAVRAQRT